MKAESDFDLPNSPSLEKRFAGTQHLLTSIERPDPRASERTLINMSETEMEEKGRNGDAEKGPVEAIAATVITKDHKTQDPTARAKMFMWMFINTLATVFIVSRHHSCPTTSHHQRSVDAPGQGGIPRTSILWCSSHNILTVSFSFRSFATKPSSPILPSHNVRPPSPRSTSS